VETIAFYSYKGGVGRTLLLANTARYLAALGRRVVALDLDLEAPGLHYKLVPTGRSTRRKRSAALRNGGAVPYLVATAEGSTSPPALDKHLFNVPVPPASSGWLRLMPAGPAPQKPYWTALRALRERLRFDDESGHGLMALLDLQARIEEEVKPHYLLIDARTGVTELGSLATTVLADTVICLFVANQESIDGTTTVVEALKAAPRLEEQGLIRIVPVLSRTTEAPTDSRILGGLKHLLALGEGRSKDGKPAIFTLPHDERFAVSERVVGGDREASAFSPLYEAYLQLYQHLFPSNAERAREELDRLEAIAAVKEQLIERRRGGRYGFGPYLKPWSPTAIEEGIEVESQRYGEPKRRYADLVCRDTTGRVVMVVEYVSSESVDEAKKFWQEKTDVRCVVLVGPAQNGTTQKILSRPPDEWKLRESDRWDVPLPKEFELFHDVGDRSVESMLDALRRGHQEATAWLVEEWRLSVAALSEMRGPAWRPARAKRILDGLAATEDPVCGEAVLRLATLPDPHPMRRERRMFREDWSVGDEYDRWMEAELLAPLFWRLPVEAVLRYQEPREYRGEVSSQAGYRFLAVDLMGLQYEAVRIALLEAESYSRRFPSSVSSSEDSDVALRWVHRRWWRTVKLLQITDALPGVLIWDELLREKPSWRGSLHQAIEELGPQKQRELGAPSELRARLRGLVDRSELVTEGLLGERDADRGIILNRPALVATAELMGLSPRHVKSVTFMHLAALALAHDARDLDEEPGYGFAPGPSGNLSALPSPVHVGLAQAFTHRLILRLGDANLLAAFEKLSEHQAEPYRRWETLRHLSLEQLRVLLLRARGNSAIIGLPRPPADEG
jgi:hypothetical protein